jgi:hypothetical protein
MSPLDGPPDASDRHRPPGPTEASRSPEDVDWYSLRPEPGAPLPAAEHRRDIETILANVANARIGRVVALRIRLWGNGYRPVAVRNAVKHDPRTGKAPLAVGWSERARRNPPADVVEPPDARAMNTGILGDGLRLVDGDIDEPDLAHRIRALACSHFGPTIVRTRSTSSRFALLYRAAEGEPAKRVIASAEGKGSIEILGRGQQFVAYGQHYTGAALYWPDGGPDTTPVTQLPAVAEDQVTAFLTAVSPLLGAAPPEAPRPEQPRALGELRPYCEKRLRGARKAILEAPPGQRHRTVLRQAFSVGGLVEGYGMPGGLALDELERAALEQPRSPPKPTQTRILKAVRDAFLAGLAKPWRPRS